MDLTALIGFTAPGSVARVRRWENLDGSGKDLWAGIEGTNAKMQAALDTLVEWVDGVTPPTGAEVRANVAAFNADRAAKQQTAAEKRALEARANGFDIGRLFVSLIRDGTIPKTSIPAGQLDALNALAEIDGKEPL